MKMTDWFSPIKSGDVNPIELLFKRLDGLYHGRWRSNFPTAESIQNWQQAWAEAFSEDRITPEMIKRGLENCRDMYDFPPTLPQFLKACREPSKNEMRHRQQTAQLENNPTPCTPEEAAAHIAKIKEMLSKNGPILKNVTEVH